MKFVSALLLVLVSTFVAGSVLDACPENEGGPCPPSCHVACVDGCTVAPVEVPAPVASPLASTPERRLESAFTPLEITFPPEVFPPKA